MRDITHFLLATLLSLATLACRHDTPPADGSLSRQLPPDTKEILRQLNDRDNREEALRLADSLAASPFRRPVARDPYRPSGSQHAL